MSKKKKEDKVEEPKKGKKPKAEKKPAKATKPVKPKAAKPIVISNDDIALRAYYIAEDRQRRGEPGDSHGDWVEAERQLQAEAKKQK